MQRIVRASAPVAVQTDPPRTQTLPPQVVQSAVQRLRWVCLTCAVLTASSVYLDARLQPEVGGLLKGQIHSLVWLFVILSALSISAVQRVGLLSPRAILNFGLVFEVAVAAAISFSETTIPMSLDIPVVGVSKVALWIAVVGLLIPNKPWIKLLTALTSAATWPLAYALNIYIGGYAPIAVNRLVMWIHLPFVISFVTYLLSKRMYVMEEAAQTARELGSYQLDSLIGRGGMGEVWRARHRMLAREAAIKVIRSDLMIMQSGYEADVTRKRFAREAQAIASLQSPHTVYIFDFGVSEDGSFYYVMELLNGVSVQTLVERFGPQPASRVVHMLQQVCQSLEEAHRRGLVHRDIKPSNLFVCKVGLEYDFMKVLDFGLVKNVSPAETMDLTGRAVAGTPAYMAPEVALGEEQLDGRVDIYALGCVAYFLLTGSRVFDERTPTASTMAHVQKTPVRPSQRTEMPVPPQLEEIILQCLAKKPDDRPQSAHELSRMLESVVELPKWTQETAFQWWQTHQPVLDRAARLRRVAAADAPLRIPEAGEITS